MRLPERVQAALTLTRFQAVIGITAGFLSIIVTGYGFFFASSRVHVTTGEVVTIVREARGAKPVADAIVEIRTPSDALVTTLLAQKGEVRQTLKEGVYRLRVLHPKFTTEVRHVQVLAGHNQEIHISLAPRPVEKPSPLEKARQAVKKLFR